MGKKRDVELLAPAGGPKQFIAAVNAGADAIYLGGPQFNARINAENFVLSELEECVDYGHLRGVKTYVTMNTLMSDSELPKALEYAKELYNIGVDALIVQDLGFGDMVRSMIPDFELHLSTQATVYNAAGVMAAKELGYERVVLSRELSLKEISECCNLGPEIEVFVHGAMCYCYSGQCQLSRFIGLVGENKDIVRSGNRGTCAQPCRLPYTYIHQDGTKDSNQYPLSPKDLSMIDHIGELIDMGIKSFKIEGRMKSPEYVKTVTGIYRKYIDKYLKDGTYQVSPEDRFDLAQIFNRGGFTEGYAVNDPGDDFMCYSVPKNQGVLIGEVESSKGLYGIINLHGPLDMHDVVEIRSGGASSSFMITYLEKLGKNKVKIGDLKEEIHSGDLVYRLVSSELNSRKLADRRSTVDLSFTARYGESMKLNATVKNLMGRKYSVSYELEDFTLDLAKSKAVTEEEITIQLSKTGETPFEPGNIKFFMDDNLFIPVSKLNELRRNALEKLEKEILESTKRDKEIVKSTNMDTEIHDSAKYDIEVKDDIEINSNLNESNETNSDSNVIVEVDIDVLNDDNTVVLPQISKGEFDSELPGIAHALSKKDGARVIANNIGELYLLGKEKASNDSVDISGKKDLSVNEDLSESQTNKASFEIVGGYGLNIYNKETARVYQKMGMGKEYIKSLENFSISELDDVPLMVTEHEMKSGKLIDRKGQEYAVEFNADEHKTYIFKL